MSADLVKYCSVCNYENTAIASFCEKCDADLMNTPATMRRDETEVPAPKVISNPSAKRPQSGCHENQGGENNHLDESEHATRHVQAKNAILELELVANPAICFTVRPGQTVGRSTRADVVLKEIPDLEYISRIHVRFTQRRDQWYVQYVSEGNSITVDGVESCDDAEIALYDQSILVLSFSSFRVRLR